MSFIVRIFIFMGFVGDGSLVDCVCYFLFLKGLNNFKVYCSKI